MSLSPPHSCQCCGKITVGGNLCALSFNSGFSCISSAPLWLQTEWRAMSGIFHLFPFAFYLMATQWITATPVWQAFRYFQAVKVKVQEQCHKNNLIFCQRFFFQRAALSFSLSLALSLTWGFFLGLHFSHLSLCWSLFCHFLFLQTLFSFLMLSSAL